MRVSGGATLGSRLLVVALAAAALLTGCGEGSSSESVAATAVNEETTPAEPKKDTATVEEELYGLDPGKGCPKRERPPGALSIALDGWETPETAGILIATERGYFDRLGLEANTYARPTPASAIPEVVEGYDDIGITHEPEALLAREKGAPIVILRSLVQEPTAALIWLQKSKIGGVADLKGKTVGIPGLPFQELFLRKALENSGVDPGDVKVETVGYKLVEELVNGHVDAILGRPNLQGAELKTRGLDPVIIPIRELGIPAFDEFVLVARTECLSQRPRMFHDFLSALARGNAAAANDPEEALRALMVVEESNPETSRKAMAAQLKATLPLISNDGDVSRAQARHLERWMHEEGMIHHEVPLRPLLSSSR
jgi:putative hydroxymethylpyrimidine transport system substrate-binding protein